MVSIKTQFLKREDKYVEFILEKKVKVFGIPSDNHNIFSLIIFSHIPPVIPWENDSTEKKSFQPEISCAESVFLIS